MFSVLVADCRIIVVGLDTHWPGPLDLDLKDFRPPRPKRERPCTGLQFSPTIMDRKQKHQKHTPGLQHKCRPLLFSPLRIYCLRGVCTPLMEVFEQLAGRLFPLADASWAPEFMYRYLIGWEECICLYFLCEVWEALLQLLNRMIFESYTILASLSCFVTDDYLTRSCFDNCVIL